MDKQQKQIEKMLKLDIEESISGYSAFINDMRISKAKPLSVSKTVISLECPKKYILSAIGIPENAVVLTREEYERQQKDNEDFDKFARSISDIRMKNGNKIATFKDLQDYIELQVKQGSKETAEKIRSEARLRSSTWETPYGYEILEISIDTLDEICNDIIGTNNG